MRFLSKEIDIIRNHHERPDGKGYPRGLQKRNLDLLTGILTVADAFDAMTSTRAYSSAMSLEDSIIMMQEGKGSQFNEDIVDTLIRLIRIGALDEILHSAQQVAK